MYFSWEGFVYCTLGLVVHPDLCCPECTVVIMVLVLMDYNVLKSCGFITTITAYGWGAVTSFWHLVLLCRDTTLDESVLQLVSWDLRVPPAMQNSSFDSGETAWGHGLAAPSAVGLMLLGLALQHHISRGFETNQPSTSKSTNCAL